MRSGRFKDRDFQGHGAGVWECAGLYEKYVKRDLMYTKKIYIPTNCPRQFASLSSGVEKFSQKRPVYTRKRHITFRGKGGEGGHAMKTWHVVSRSLVQVSF